MRRLLLKGDAIRYRCARDHWTVVALSDDGYVPYSIQCTWCGPDRPSFAYYQSMEEGLPPSVASHFASRPDLASFVKLPQQLRAEILQGYLLVTYGDPEWKAGPRLKYFGKRRARDCDFRKAIVAAYDKETT